MGANQGRAKGNEQEAEYGKPDGTRGKPGGTDGGERGSESGIGNCGSHCEAEAGITERKKQRLSSEMLKRKRTEGNGRKRKSGIDPRGEICKGITCGTAAGAKQGRTKGNGQESRVREPGENA